MRVLITGNLGYVGGVLTEHLSKTHQDWDLIGLDTGYFADDLTGPKPPILCQINRDIRDVTEDDIAGTDAVVHLAAISNDPMGNEFEEITDTVNHIATVRLAKMCVGLGIKKFVFASSCSVYGAAGDSHRKEKAILAPITSYGRSKRDAEVGLFPFLDDIQFSVLRFATACGMSPRLRLDLVLNDFVASALISGKIEVLSDGTPWRPLIAVTDMARAIEWALVREGKSETVNVGSNDWCWTIGSLAKNVASILGCEFRINDMAVPDKRSYRVDFSKFARIAPDHQPIATFWDVVHELRAGMSGMTDLHEWFRVDKYARLHALRSLIEQGKLNSDLRWLK